MTSGQPSERDRCPHCGVVADVEAARRLRFRCRVCGGPRVPLDDAAVERSGRERKALKKAQRLRFRHAAWMAAAAALGGFGLVALLVTLAVLLVVSTGIVGAAVALLAAASPLVLAGYAGRKTQSLSAELSERIAEAWRAVAEDVVAHDDTHATPEHLSFALRIDDEAAERLLTDLSVHDVIRARVTDNGDLVYHRSDAPPKWRVGGTTAPPSAGLEPDTADDAALAEGSATTAEPED